MEPAMNEDKKLKVLARLARALNGTSITWALGASAMLYFRGITDAFHDIDLMVAEDDALRAKAELEKLGTRNAPRTRPDTRYRTAHFYEFTVDAVEVDLMAGFVIVKDDIAHTCPLRVEDIDGCAQAEGERVPLHSLAVWRTYYALMDRAEKVRMIDAAVNERT